MNGAPLALVGYESSGVVRRALAAQGFNAWSCDLHSAADGDPQHMQADIWDVLAMGWNWALGIFHPPCTFLTCSAEWAYGDGPYHQQVKPGTLVGAARRKEREGALEEIRSLMALPFPSAIENPRGAISRAIRKPDQTIQPYQFGDDASKATCLWLDGLPLLIPTQRRPGRWVIDPRNGKPVERWANQTNSGQNRLSPGPDRWKKRSETYPGIASAMAEQWGRFLLSTDQHSKPEET